MDAVFLAKQLEGKLDKWIEADRIAMNMQEDLAKEIVKFHDYMDELSGDSRVTVTILERIIERLSGVKDRENPAVAILKQSLGKS